MKKQKRAAFDKEALADPMDDVRNLTVKDTSKFVLLEFCVCFFYSVL
jgi:hypothetical protein